MIRSVLFALAALSLAHPALGQSAALSEFDPLIALHADANGVPTALVHRVIRAESRYNPHAAGKDGAMGLMQIKHATARGLGYAGSPSGLLDPATNLTYGVRYLAGAYRAADGNADRAVSYYRRGYYYSAKHKRVVAASQRRVGPPLNLQAWSLRGAVTP
jgi:soluble lytic murein transglycosylase-like protein